MSREQAVTLPLGDQRLPAIFHPGVSSSRVGVVIVVGGPQYRVGSHRQFLHLARWLAAAGVPVLRFDARGMGDASGDKQPFDHLDEDIRAALDGLCSRAPRVEGVVLWGLCDGASAALLYADKDERVAGLVLVNPWLENVQSEARTRLIHYYLKRLSSGGFWRKFIGGRVAIADSLRGVGSAARQASTTGNEKGGYQQRMRDSFEAYTQKGQPVLLVLSANDLTAKTFERQYRSEPHWRHLSTSTRVSVEIHPEADHTFSSSEWKAWLGDCTLAFVKRLSRS